MLHNNSNLEKCWDGRGELGINWYNYDLSHPMWVVVLLISFLGSEPEFRPGEGRGFMGNNFKLGMKGHLISPSSLVCLFQALLNFLNRIRTLI